MSREYAIPRNGFVILDGRYRNHQSMKSPLAQQTKQFSHAAVPKQQLNMRGLQVAQSVPADQFSMKTKSRHDMKPQ